MEELGCGLRQPTPRRCSRNSVILGGGRGIPNQLLPQSSSSSHQTTSHISCRTPQAPPANANPVGFGRGIPNQLQPASTSSSSHQTPSRRSCRNSPDLFCYVCGVLTPTSQKRAITSPVYEDYKSYFGILLGDQHKPWARHIICKSCHTTLASWAAGKPGHMKFAIPMVWREPKNHHSDCYFVW